MFDFSEPNPHVRMSTVSPAWSTNLIRPTRASFTCPRYIRLLYDDLYDFPEVTEPPRVEYMLATLPRSGSTYLALELWRSGVMGAPIEYANPCFAGPMRLRLKLRKRPLTEYWSTVKRLRTSPNGVFGYKLFSTNYIHWSLQNRAMLAAIMPQKVVFLSRDDHIAQAVSYSKAIRSGSWFHGTQTHRQPSYDPVHIKRCVDMLAFQTNVLNHLFAATGTDVCRVGYDELLEDANAVVQKIVRFVGVEFE